MEDNKNTPLPEENASHNGEEKKQEKKEFFITKKIKEYAKANPKRTFMIMMGLLVLSVVGSIVQYIYIKNVVKPRMEEKTQLDLISDFENTYSVPEDAVKHNYFELQSALKELEYYKEKEVLTAQDSARIKYLIDKYNPSKNEEN